MSGAGRQLSFREFEGTYEPRRAEKTVLYQAVAHNFRTFEAIADLNGKSLPTHVTEEFEAFLKCGILARGFLRVVCGDCKYEKLLAFSCKKRGFCSSCGGRRMAESAAHLIDRVFPRAGIRQWVLSFPMPIRFILAKNPKIQSKVLTIVHRVIAASIKKKASQRGLRTPLQPGAVTLIQRFGGSLNLNVHYHMLFLEGGFIETERGPRLWWVSPPSDEEIKEIVIRIASRVIRFLKKRGYFRDEIDSALPDEENQGELYLELQAASVQSRIATGERRGQRVRRLGVGEYSDFQAELKGPLCASTQGFSLHAEVYCAPWEREKLEKLCRYIARPAVAEDRLALRPSGDIVLRLKTKYSDGTSHLLFSGLEFMEKLAALVPPPRIHLTRFFGCFAPNSKIRSEIVPKETETLEVTTVTEACKEENKQKKSSRMRWAELLARVFSIDMKHCPSCGSESFRVIAAVIERSAVKKVLSHLGLPDQPPDITPARVQQMSF